ADELPLIVADRIHDDTRPEAMTVLADSPPLHLDSAGTRRRLERLARHAPLPILLGVEEREMPADDLFRAIALDPLGAGVPARDEAARVDHEDGVVRHPFDEQSEAALGFMHTSGGLLDLAGALFDTLLQHLVEAA